MLVLILNWILNNKKETPQTQNLRKVAMTLYLRWAVKPKQGNIHKRWNTREAYNPVWPEPKNTNQSEEYIYKYKRA